MMFEFNVIHKQLIQIRSTRLFHFLFPVASISFPSLKPLMRILMRKKMISTPLRMENPVRRPMVPPIIASDDSKVTWKHSSLKINLKKKVIILITVNFKNSEISIQTSARRNVSGCLSVTTFLLNHQRQHYSGPDLHKGSRFPSLVLSDHCINRSSNNVMIIQSLPSDLNFMFRWYILALFSAFSLETVVIWNTFAPIDVSAKKVIANMVER